MSFELVTTLLYLLTGGFLIFLAVTIIRDNIGSRLNRTTGSMLFFVGLGPLFIALATIIRQSPSASVGFEESTLYNLQYLWHYFFPLLLLFSWIFPEDRYRSFKHPRLRYLIFIPQTINIVLVLFFDQIRNFLTLLRVDPNQEGFASIILNPLASLLSYLLIILSFVRTYQIEIFGVLNLFYVASAMYFLETSRRQTSTPQIAAQSQFVFIGLRTGLLLYVVAFLGNLTVPEIITESVSSLILLVALLVGSGMLVYATIRYQFLDVRLHFRQSFVYTVTSALLVGVYILLVVKSKEMLEPAFGAQAEILSYTFILILLIFFQPINSAVDNFVRSLFMRTRTDHRTVIERFSRQVISLFDPVRLRTIIEDTLKTSILVDKVYFVLFDDNINEYALLESEDSDCSIPINRNDLLLRGINLLDAPTSLTTMRDYMDDSELATILQERKVKLVLPMKDAKHMLGFIALTGKIAGYRYSSDDINLLGVLSNQMVTALTNVRLYVDSLERIRLQEEVAMARQIQVDLLPTTPPQVDSLAFSVHSTPSRTVGGDFYDFIEVDNDRWGIVIADASGKGMPAALMIAQIQAMIRSEVNNGTPIHEMMRNVNEQLSIATSSEKYVTLFYGEMDPTNGDFHYCNAGHNYPILVRADGTVELLQIGGPIVGALSGMSYQAGMTRLHCDDLLLMFTDGVSEAMDHDENEYGEDRLRELVRKFRKDEPQKLLNRLLDDVRSHDASDPPRDDTTIVAMKVRDGNRSLRV